MNPQSRILIIQTAFPGDSVLALPFIQEVKRLNPGSEVDVVSTPLSAEIFAASPSVTGVIPFDKRGEHKAIGGISRFAAGLKSRGYQKVYSLHRSFRTTLLVNLIRAPHSVGFDSASLSFLYDERISYIHKDHEVKRNLNMLGDYSGDRWRIKPEVESTSAQREKVDAFLSVNGVSGATIVISPGSVWETKRYPLRSYAEVAASLSSLGYNIIVSGSAAEREMGEEIRKIAGGKIVNSCGEFSMVGTIELFRRVSLVVTNDSAPTHFAMAAGAPVLTIYCSTVPEFGFYGYLPESFHLSKELGCKPCGVHGHKKCPNGSFECGTGILPYEVVEKVIDILKAK